MGACSKKNNSRSHWNKMGFSKQNGFFSGQIGSCQNSLSNNFNYELQAIQDGCKKCILEWLHQRISVCGTAPWLPGH